MAIQVKLALKGEAILKRSGPIQRASEVNGMRRHCLAIGRLIFALLISVGSGPSFAQLGPPSPVPIPSPMPLPNQTAPAPFPSSPTPNPAPYSPLPTPLPFHLGGSSPRPVPLSQSLFPNAPRAKTFTAHTHRSNLNQRKHRKRMMEQTIG